MDNSKDIIGNRTRDLPACSAVPQPTARLRAPGNSGNLPYDGIQYTYVPKFYYGVHIPGDVDRRRRKIKPELRSGYTESEYMSNGGRFVAACW